MTTQQLLATLYLLATDPVIQAIAGVAGTAVLAAASWAVANRSDARAYAQELADLSEAIEPMVKALEPRFLPGSHKYGMVLDQAQAWLADRGIKGDARRVLERHLPALIELAVKRVGRPP
jgi:hypothetical protein